MLPPQTARPTTQSGVLRRRRALHQRGGRSRRAEAHQAALGRACDSIRLIIRDLGISETKAGPAIVTISSRRQRARKTVQAIRHGYKDRNAQFDLRHYFHITEQGREYLKPRSGMD